MKIRVRRAKANTTNLLVGQQYDVRRQGITQSLLSKWLSCRESARLYLTGLTTLQRKSAMMAGSLYHDALERLYRRAQAAYPDPMPGAANFQLTVTDLLDSMDDTPPQNAESIQETEQTFAMMEAVLPGYLEHWLEDFTGGVEWTKVEEVFRVPAPGVDGVFLTGKIDGAFTRGPKSLWLFETKTKAQIQGATMDDALPLDMQVQFYLYALSKITGRKPRGVLYNVIRRPQLRQKKSESSAEFRGRVHEDVKARPDHYFKRWEVPVSVDEMRHFERSLSDMVREFVAWCDGSVATYRNGNSCLRPWPCSYLPVCSTGSEAGYFIRDHIFSELEV